MKLLELVCRNIDEWPDDECVAITQDSTDDNGVYYWRKIPKFSIEHCDWRGKNGAVCGLLTGARFFMRSKDDPDDTFSLCEDYDTAIITRELFEEAKMNEKTVAATQEEPKCDLIAWRDRIIEIGRLIGDLSIERNQLYSNINKAGFKLDLDGMK